MSEFLFHYHKVHPATWAYLSSLLVLALFFKFSRFWSVRNVDLALLILLAPGLLLVNYGRELQIEAVRTSEQLKAATESSAANSPATSSATSSAADPTQPSSERSTRPTVASSGAPAEPTIGTSTARPVPSVATADSQPDASEEGSEDGVESSQPVDAQVPVELRAWASEQERIRRLTENGRRAERTGFFGLLAIAFIFLVRLLLDPTMVRRPLLEPNLSTGGMVFMGCALFAFLMANVVTSEPTADDLRGAAGAQRILVRASGQPQTSADLERHGPGYALLSLLPSIPTVTLLPPSSNGSSSQNAFAIVAKVMAFASHLAIVLGMIAVGYRHFDNIRMGIGAALLYLLLPYTSIMTGRVDHVLPAALLVWAVLSYRRPLAAGVFIGLATGVVYYPAFLLPLWFSFYRQRGVWRFASGLLASLLAMTLSLALVSDSWTEFWLNVQKMFGLWLPVGSGLEGVWGLSWDPVYRLPVLGGFVVLSCTLAIWPARKNLGTLLSCSSALMVATQFWHGYGGGLYMAWFLPLTLLTIFRPNLEDRVALSVLGESWFVRRRPRLAAVGEAA